MENQQSFWQFSDQLRLQSTNFSNLSINDSIWSTSFGSKKPEQRRNFDSTIKPKTVKQKGTNFDGFNDEWKVSATGTQTNFNGFNENWKLYKGENQKTLDGFNDVLKINQKNNNNGVPTNKEGFKVPNKKNNNNNDGKSGEKNNNNNNKDNKNATDKRFKTLPPSEALPRNEAIGGYIFVCNNDTMEENLRRQLFGLPPRYRDSVRAITPGLPLFLYNYSTHQLHGIFQAASFGGTNIDPSAWEDKKCPGGSRFPAQVRVMTKKICEPLEEDSFRPVLHHYDGPKFRLELSVPEALALLDVFSENNH